VGRIVVSVLITVDGVVEQPDRWAGPSRCPESVATSTGLREGSDALLLGRLTHRYLCTHGAVFDGTTTDALGRMPTHVVSSTLSAVGGHSTLVRGDAVRASGALRQNTDRSYLVLGSPTLARALLPAGLVDELVLHQCPVVVGGGATLFPAGVPPLQLEPAGAEQLAGGRTLLRFHAPGLRTSFAERADAEEI
jgi:dihydrofolate reductase